jgi:hypothetical protein
MTDPTQARQLTCVLPKSKKLLDSGKFLIDADYKGFLFNGGFLWRNNGLGCYGKQRCFEAHILQVRNG